MSILLYVSYEWSMLLYPWQRGRSTSWASKRTAHCGACSSWCVITHHLFRWHWQIHCSELWRFNACSDSTQALIVINLFLCPRSFQWQPCKVQLESVCLPGMCNSLLWALLSSFSIKPNWGALEKRLGNDTVQRLKESAGGVVQGDWEMSVTDQYLDQCTMRCHCYGLRILCPFRVHKKKLGSICVYLRVNIDCVCWLLKRKDSHVEGNKSLSVLCN